MAVQKKDYGTAEREFKQAVAVSQHPAFQWTTSGQRSIAAAEVDRSGCGNPKLE
jgi:hypothetical protein